MCFHLSMPLYSLLQSNDWKYILYPGKGLLVQNRQQLLNRLEISYMRRNMADPYLMIQLFLVGCVAQCIPYPDKVSVV